MCLFTSDLPVDMSPSRRVLQAYCYQASSYVLSTDNNRLCDSLHCCHSKQELYCCKEKSPGRKILNIYTV